MSLEDLSFRNLVIFHAGRLRQIMNGQRASELFNKRERMCLKKYGIFLRVYFGYRKGGSVTLPTPRALKILEELG